MSARSLAIGRITLTRLSDGHVTYPWNLDQLFPGVPADAWDSYRQRYPSTFAESNLWRSDYCCCLIRSEQLNILVDTGMGPATTSLAQAFHESGRLLQELGAAGVEPEEIDLVVLTHLHPDHVGWNIQQEAGQKRLTFSRARYLVHRADWDVFHQAEVQAHFPPGYIQQLVTPLEALGGLELVAGDRALTDEVSAVHTPGHTPGHMIVRIESGDERAVIVGDVLLHPAQVTHPEWNSMFEMDEALARENRRALLERLENERALVVANHFAEAGVGRLVQSEGNRYWQPV